MKRIILSGCCGAMGKAIYRCAVEGGDEIAAGIDKNKLDYPFEIFASPLECKIKADAVIDFSHPSLFEGIVDFCLQKKLPLVCGTTGLGLTEQEHMLSAAQKIPVFYATNMSWGVYVFNKLAALAAKMLYGDYDIEIIEKHHKLKLDSPSGTAMTLLKNLQNQVPALQPVFGRHGNEKRKQTEIGLNSVRGGTIVGEHEVIYAGNNELISISHSAQSKEIFALGALRAVKFLLEQKAGLYNMDDMARFYNI